jgi:hypothetical protein
MFSVGATFPRWLVQILEHQELPLLPLHDLAFPRSHDKGMHALHRVGINGISQDLMIFI